MLSSATAVAVVVVAIALAAFFVKALSSAFLLASKALSYFDGCLEAAFALAATASSEDSTTTSPLYLPF